MNPSENVPESIDIQREQLGAEEKNSKWPEKGGARSY